MQQTNANAAKPRTSRKRRLLLFLCLASVLLFCLVSPVGVFVLGRRHLDARAEAENRKEIEDLQEAVMRFQAKYNVDYIPSRIRLLDSGEYDLSLNANGLPNNQLDYDSYQYLTRVWPRLQFPVDWGNRRNNRTSDKALQGDECLVFFLGGIRSYSYLFKCQGFSTNGINPSQQDGERVGPFCDFKNLAIGPNGYFTCLDAYGTPFAYFSSYKTRNGYNRYGDSDCTGIPDGPYHDGNGNYYNPDSFQIISAGPDRKFGRGGKWNPEHADEIDPNGRDDMSNFHSTLLGKPR